MIWIFRPFNHQPADVSFDVFYAVQTIRSFDRYNLVAVKLKIILRQSRYIDYRVAANRKKSHDKYVWSALRMNAMTTFEKNSE